MAIFFENEKEPVTALFDEDGNQLLETVGILEMSTSPSNTYAEHTLEDGKVIIDNKIINRVVISVTAILSPDDYKQAYAKIKEADKNNTYPYNENASIVNTIAITINFTEQQIVAAKVVNLPPEKVKSQPDADTVDSGQKLPKEQPSTTLLDLLNSAGVL